ncbi:hypothetical protein [Sphingobium sp.]|uniref:hypothetical protein n=1 Tax=Sphingobium sp. TaxID=1912891 RepID=UPI0035C72847
MLMLGSLKCRATHSEITGKYDKFYEKTGQLDKYNNALKLHFMRENGISGGQNAYNDFITRLANSHSIGMQSAGFCQMADTLLTLAINAGEGDIPILARNFSERPAGVGDMCEVIAAPAPVPAPALAPAVSVDPGVAPSVMPVAAAEAAPAAVPAAQVTPQSAAAALEAAPVALQNAAASLKTQPTAPADGAAVGKPTLVADSKPVS